MSFSGGRRGGTEGPLLWLSVFPCAIVPLDLMSHKVQGSYGKGWAARLFDLFSRISHISHISLNQLSIIIMSLYNEIFLYRHILTFKYSKTVFSGQ